MRRRWLLRALVLVALAGSASPTPGGRPVGLALAPGDPAPPLSGNTLDRQRVYFQYNKHKATLVNFWATWCAPCREEIPSLQQLHAERGSNGLAVVGVLMDSVEPELAQAFLNELGATYMVLKPDRRTESGWTGAGVMPLTYLVDGQGKIVRRYVGATPQQVTGMVVDAQDFLEGRPLGTQVLPETPAVVSQEEHWREKRAEEEAKAKEATKEKKADEGSQPQPN